MEEDIKILEELEEFMKEELRAEHSIFSIEQLQAIENLIARYKELKEENRKLTARKYMFNAETGELKEIPTDNNYIPKSKVQEKIEHRIKKLEKMQEEDMKSDDRYYDEYDYEMTLLKSVERELLEES